jgi:hypothetical protein
MFFEALALDFFTHVCHMRHSPAEYKQRKKKVQSGTGKSLP